MLTSQADHDVVRLERDPDRRPVAFGESVERRGPGGWKSSCIRKLSMPGIATPLTRCSAASGMPKGTVRCRDSRS